MSSTDEEFLAQLRAAFNVEAAEHLQAMVTGLMEMEKASTPTAQREWVAVVFRAAHSLKGAAGAVGLADVESQCHVLEDLFVGWKRQQGPPTPTAIDTAHRALSAVSAALSAPAVATAGALKAAETALSARCAVSIAVGVGGPCCRFQPTKRSSRTWHCDSTSARPTAPAAPFRLCAARNTTATHSRCAVGVDAFSISIKPVTIACRCSAASTLKAARSCARNSSSVELMQCRPTPAYSAGPSV